jgi:D-glucosaminate-6-phosphate ammonia-lyase
MVADRTHSGATWLPEVYRALGVQRVVNAQGRYTTLGASLLPAEVTSAMALASRCYVDVFELQRRAGARLAELTRNEAAYVCNGAAAGLFLATLACMTGTDRRAIARLPELGTRREVVIHRSHRMPMDPAIVLTGARLVEVGNIMRTETWELQAALNEHTAAVVFMAGDFFAQGSLSLERTVELAHEAGVPVVVDAAAQLPPPDNLWRYTRDCGADLAIFSGGKDLCGPQASGIILGREDLLAAVHLLSSPHTSLARPMKVGKEEVVGLVAAVERYLSLDHAARLAEFESVVEHWCRELGTIPGLQVQRSFPNTMGQPVPRAAVDLDQTVTGLGARRLAERLLAGEPPVAVRVRPHENRVFLSPDTLQAGEAQLVADRIRDELSGPGSGSARTG